MIRMLQSSPESDATSSPESIAGDAFELTFESDVVPRVQPSLLYRLGIAAVAATMIVLPLLYAALVIGLAVALGTFAVINVPSTGSIPSMLFYSAVLISGATVIAFLVKPLFVREAKATALVELEAGEQERLERLVADISRLVGAPMPAKIAVDCAVNASVSFRRGLYSLFGSDLILVIGLPLVRSLNARSFAGVIAHEMGHFGQGAGMRLTYVIRRLNGWFYRVVYFRDGWDHWLRRGAQTSRLGILFQVAQLGIWGARRILFVLMLVGQAVSCFVLRRMEFDADHYEICVAGTDGFRETTERIALLHDAAVVARGIVDESLAGGALPDDLPLLISKVAGMTCSAAQSRIVNRMTESGSGLLDTHPSDWERIGRALAMREPGLVICKPERCASELFDDLDRLSMSATRRHFSVLNGNAGLDALEENESKWVSARQLAAFEQRNRGLEEAADRFAGYRLELWDGAIRALPPALNRKDDVASMKRTLRKLTRTFNGSAAQCKRIARAVAELDSEYVTALKGKELMCAGYSLNHEARTRVASGLSQRKALAELRDELADFQDLASQRLGLVFALEFPANDCAEAVPAALTFLDTCCRMRPTIIRMRELLLRQMILIQHIEPGCESTFEFRSRIQANAAHLRGVCGDLLNAISDLRDPVSETPATVGAWLCSASGKGGLSDDPVFRGYQEAEEILRRLGKRYRQVLGVVATSVFSAEVGI